jgi:hypothetical protein
VVVLCTPSHQESRSDLRFTALEGVCGTGFAVGNTNSFLREYLLAEGFDVYAVLARIWHAGQRPFVDHYW